MREKQALIAAIPAAGSASPPPRRPPLHSGASQHITRASHVGSSAASSVLTAPRRSHTSPFRRDNSIVAEPPHILDDAHISRSRSAAIVALGPILAWHWTRAELADIVRALGRLRAEAERRLRLQSVGRWLRWAAQKRAARILYEAVCLPHYERLAHAYFLRWQSLGVARAVASREFHRHTLLSTCFQRWLTQHRMAVCMHTCARSRELSCLSCLMRVWHQRTRRRMQIKRLAAVRVSADVRLAQRAVYRWLLWTLTPRLTTRLLERVALAHAQRVFEDWQRVTLLRVQLRTLTIDTCRLHGRRALSLWSLWAVRRRQARQLARENTIRHARLVWCRWLLNHRRHVQRRRRGELTL